MRILYFSSRECWPPNTGGRLRDYHLARELAERGQVTYLGLRNLKDPPAVPPPDGTFERSLIVDKEAVGYALPKLIRGLAGPVPVTVLNCQSSEATAALGRLLDEHQFDTVQMEGVHLVGYLPQIQKSRHRPQVVVDWHNIESELMASYGSKAPTLPHRLYAQRTASLIEGMENRLLRDARFHTVTSDRERSILLKRPIGDVATPVINVIGNGVDTDWYRDEAGDGPEEAGSSSELIFVGSMDYHANIDAAVWFADEVWPKLLAQHPELRFTIVGRNPAPAVAALAGRPGIAVTGTVDDVRPYYRRALAMLVPLRIGSGTRLKILESMAAGVPVISTRLGAEGIDLTVGRDILLAETAEEFAKAIVLLSTDRELRRSIRESARMLVKSRYDWSVLGDALFEVHSRAAAARS